jgi:hypothetical protein
VTTVFSDMDLQSIAIQRPRGTISLQMELTVDIPSFLGLLQFATAEWPDVTEMQVKKWYKQFEPLVQTYDDKINDYIRCLQSSSSLIIRDKHKSVLTLGNRPAAKFRPEVVTVTEDESDSEFISETEDPEAVERNRIAH